MFLYNQARHSILKTSISLSLTCSLKYSRNVNNSTNLIRIFQLLSTPPDASVCSHQDEDLSQPQLSDLEGLCVEALLQGLHADEVLQLEIPRCGPTLTELLDEALEAKADSLTCDEVAVLDLSSHVLWQEGLVAGRDSIDLLL